MGGYAHRPAIYAGTAPDVKAVAPSDIEKREGYERGVHCEPCWMRRKRVTPANGHWGSMPYCNPCRFDDRVPQREWTSITDDPNLKRLEAIAARPLKEEPGPSSPRSEYPADVEAVASTSAEEIRREIEADIQKKRSTFVGKFDAAKCLCGCGNAVFAGKRYFRGHKPPAKSQPVQTAPTPRYGSPPKEKSEMMKPCKCGCGNETNRHTGYLWGHKGTSTAKPAAVKKLASAMKSGISKLSPGEQDKRIDRANARLDEAEAAPERVQISVNAAYLDHFWQGRSTAEKARMVSNFFAEAGD